MFFPESSHGRPNLFPIKCDWHYSLYVRDRNVLLFWPNCLFRIRHPLHQILQIKLAAHDTRSRLRPYGRVYDGEHEEGLHHLHRQNNADGVDHFHLCTMSNEVGSMEKTGEILTIFSICPDSEPRLSTLYGCEQSLTPTNQRENGKFHWKPRIHPGKLRRQHIPMSMETSILNKFSFDARTNAKWFQSPASVDERHSLHHMHSYRRFWLFSIPSAVLTAETYSATYAA